jgi:hypothetical protein
MKSFKTLICIFFTLICVGCASPSASDLRAPDGTSLKNIKCNIDPQKCFLIATDSCKDTNGSYRVVSSHSNAGGTLADIIPGPVTWFNMTIACGPSDGKMPEFLFKGQQYIPQPMTMPQQRRSTTTNCTTYGSNVNCTTR